MLNYIKSEFYRMIHSSGIYVLTLCFAAAPLFMNLMLFGFKRLTPDFPYATTSFSYSNIVANPMIFCIASLCLVFTLYEGNKRNGNLKNLVACGISREKIFAGQFVVCFFASLVVMVITAAVYILSAVLLLKKEGAVEVTDFINEILSVSPVAVFALMLGILSVLLFEKTFTGILFWYSILFLIPQVLFYIGFEVRPIQEISLWMPRNFFSGMEVNQQVCAPIWDTASGLLACFISGFAGIVLFGIWGITAMRKKEF